MVEMAGNEFKALILGNKGVGKTTFIKRIITGEYDETYKPTKDTEIFRSTFFTTSGSIKFRIWEPPTQEEAADALQEPCFIGMDCAIIMFDVTSMTSYKDVPKWYNKITKINEKVPVVIVGNKIDSDNREVKTRQIQFHRKMNLHYYDLSVKTDYQLERPFLYLMRKLTNQSSLELVECHITTCFDCYNITEEQRIAMEQELELARQIPLPDDDDDEFF